jgi:Skp family chaperone for outer membrane proteins
LLHKSTADAPKSPEKEAGKICVVNMGALFRDYDKARKYKKELDAELAPIKAKTAAIEARLKRDFREPGGPVTREEMTKGCFALVDLETEARNLVGKKQETQLVEIYGDIQTALKEHAERNSYRVILGYGDPPNLDPFSFAAVNRRLDAMDKGGMTLTFVQPELDVTNAVLQRLNRR